MGSTPQRIAEPTGAAIPRSDISALHQEKQITAIATTWVNAKASPGANPK